MGNIFITCPVLLVFPEDYSAQPIVLSSTDISSYQVLQPCWEEEEHYEPSKEGNQEGLKITHEEGH